MSVAIFRNTIDFYIREKNHYWTRACFNNCPTGCAGQRLFARPPAPCCPLPSPALCSGGWCLGTSKSKLALWLGSNIERHQQGVARACSHPQLPLSRLRCVHCAITQISGPAYRVLSPCAGDCSPLSCWDPDWCPGSPRRLYHPSSISLYPASFVNSLLIKCDWNNSFKPSWKTSSARAICFLLGPWLLDMWFRLKKRKTFG